MSQSFTLGSHLQIQHAKTTLAAMWIGYAEMEGKRIPEDCKIVQARNKDRGRESC